jgi:hypothetical protein
MNSSVYWIHCPEHTDILTQGYIGVSNNTKYRWREHQTRTENIHLQRAIKKYNWDNLIKEVIVIADELYCLAVEFKLRAKDSIGWNIVAGGGMPPSSLGKKFIRTEEYKAQMSISKMGHKHTPEMQAKLNLNLTEGGKATRFIKGQVPHNKGMPMLAHVKEAIKKANVGRVQPQKEIDKRAKSLLGHVVTQETRDKISIGNMGHKSPMAGKHFLKVICPHCNIEGGLTGMKSWHFDNCRNKGAD